MPQGSTGNASIVGSKRHQSAAGPGSESTSNARTIMLKEKPSKIDPGLDRLIESAPPLQAIASACGCRAEYIRQIEARALRRLRGSRGGEIARDLRRLVREAF